MKHYDLDTYEGMNAALCDASDQLYKFAAGEHVILARPGYPQARVVVSEPWHMASDGNGGSCGQVSVSYMVKGGPEFSVMAWHLVSAGWQVWSDEGSRVCVFEVI